jgi:hypothetical protein
MKSFAASTVATRELRMSTLPRTCGGAKLSRAYLAMPKSSTFTTSVPSAIGCRNTASENTAPKATQVISAPAATITQP